MKYPHECVILGACRNLCSCIHYLGIIPHQFHHLLRATQERVVAISKVYQSYLSFSMKFDISLNINQHQHLFIYHSYTFNHAAKQEHKYVAKNQYGGDHAKHFLLNWTCLCVRLSRCNNQVVHGIKTIKPHLSFLKQKYIFYKGISFFVDPKYVKNFQNPRSTNYLPAIHTSLIQTMSNAHMWKLVVVLGYIMSLYIQASIFENHEKGRMLLVVFLF